MKRKLILPVLILSVFMTGCSIQKQEPDEEIVFGDIDLTTDYEKNNYQAPSAVKRKEEVNINDVFMKLPLNETEEKKTGLLPTIAGDKYPIERVQLNGVYFDINQIANQTDYSFKISDNIAKLTIPQEDGSLITSYVAQIADSSYMTEEYIITEEESEEMFSIIDEYESIYRDTENQNSNEYGYYYTYDKYVDWLNANDHAKYSISVYSPEQVLSLALSVLNVNKPAKDFYINTNADMLEVSDWYQIRMGFKYEKPDEDIIDISVKESQDGVFLIMTQYPHGSNFDENGDIYFTPTMIINIAQNNYYQLAEDYKSKISRENYKNGVK